MTNTEIAFLELFTVGGIGVLLILAAVLISFITGRRNRSCTELKKGTVIKYRFMGDGNISPVVSFFVNGNTYTARKKFNSIRKTSIEGLPLPIDSEAYEDEKGNLHIKTGPVANIRALAENLWPMGSTMNVFYNPDNPKICYVERPIKNTFLVWFFFLAGLFTIMLSVFMFFLIRG